MSEQDETSTPAASATGRGEPQQQPATLSTGRWIITVEGEPDAVEEAVERVEIALRGEGHTKADGRADLTVGARTYEYAPEGGIAFGGSAPVTITAVPVPPKRGGRPRGRPTIPPLPIATNGIALMQSGLHVQLYLDAIQAGVQADGWMINGEGYPEYRLCVK